MSWDLEVFPCLWLWEELCGSADYPWWGRCYVAGIEPNTTPAGGGLAEAVQTGRNTGCRPENLSTPFCAPRHSRSRESPGASNPRAGSSIEPEAAAVRRRGGRLQSAIWEDLMQSRTGFPLLAGMFLFLAGSTEVSGSEVRHLGGRLQLFLDDWLVESSDNVRRVLHRPERREAAIRVDRPWEDIYMYNPVVIKDGPSLPHVVPRQIPGKAVSDRIRGEPGRHPLGETRFGTHRIRRAPATTTSSGP